MDRNKVSMAIYMLAAAVCGFTAGRHLAAGRFVGWAWLIIGLVMLGLGIYNLVKMIRSGKEDEK